MNLQRLMYKCVQDSLASLGEPTMQSLIWHMSRSGVPVDPENFDIKKFYVALSELIDGGADVILDLVARNMAEALKLGDDFDKNLSGIERVLKILETAEKVKG